MILSVLFKYTNPALSDHRKPAGNNQKPLKHTTKSNMFWIFRIFEFADLSDFWIFWIQRKFWYANARIELLWCSLVLSHCFYVDEHCLQNSTLQPNNTHILKGNKDPRPKLASPKGSQRQPREQLPNNGRQDTRTSKVELFSRLSLGS